MQVTAGIDKKGWMVFEEMVSDFLSTVENKMHLELESFNQLKLAGNSQDGLVTYKQISRS